MGRKTTVIGFSVSPAIAKECENLASKQKTSKSELFRRMLETYKAALDEDAFFRLQRRMARRARKKGVFTEKEVDRIVFEDR